MTIVLYTLIISLFSDNLKQFEIENIHLAKNEIFPDRLFIMNRKDQNKIPSLNLNSNRNIIYVDSFMGNDSFMGTISRPKKQYRPLSMKQEIIPIKRMYMLPLDIIERG